MNEQDIYEGIGQVDDDVLLRSEKKRRARRPWWAAAAAAVVAVAVAVGFFFPHGGDFDGGPFVTTAHAVAEAHYPEMAPYPDETAADFEAQYEAWREDKKQQERDIDNMEGLKAYAQASIPAFLSGAEGENRAYSPLNVYMALSMLAELTDGESRAQILTLLGSDSLEALRSQANALWNDHYSSDGATTSVLASSLWLDEGVPFDQNTLDTLAENYYASSFQGDLGTEEMNQALQDWLNSQTGGLLQDQIGQLTLDPETLLALATTVYFQAKWSSTFSEEKTAPQTFHSPTGDVTADFMHASFESGTYYWGERFSAVGLGLANDGGTMWFLLPDEGYTPEDLLADSEAMDFLLSGGDWAQKKQLIVHVSLPKFDIASQLDLAEGLRALGVTDIFDADRADFSPMLAGNTQGIFVSQAKHGVRVAVDEEGVTAAAYTLMSMAGAGEPPADEIDFTLDRPFLFALSDGQGLPLFAGVVNQP